MIEAPYSVRSGARGDGRDGQQVHAAALEGSMQELPQTKARQGAALSRDSGKDP